MQIPKHWTFNSAEVAEGFDSHVREQLPWYNLVTWGIAQIARHYVGRGGLVYDVGASTGNIGNAIGETLAERGAQLVGIEASREMASRYRGPGTLHVADAVTFDYHPFDCAILMLLLMFLRVEDQRLLLARLQRKARAGGAIIVVDKLTQGGGYSGTVITRLAIAAKLAAGSSAEETLAKELSLSGVQRPMSPAIFSSLGFVEWFRFGDFAGYLWERAGDAPEHHIADREDEEEENPPW